MLEQAPSGAGMSLEVLRRIAFTIASRVSYGRFDVYLSTTLPAALATETPYIATFLGEAGDGPTAVCNWSTRGAARSTSERLALT